LMHIEISLSKPKCVVWVIYHACIKNKEIRERESNTHLSSSRFCHPKTQQSHTYAASTRHDATVSYDRLCSIRPRLRRLRHHQHLLLHYHADVETRRSYHLLKDVSARLFDQFQHSVDPFFSGSLARTATDWCRVWTDWDPSTHSD